MHFMKTTIIFHRKHSHTICSIVIWINTFCIHFSASINLIDLDDQSKQDTIMGDLDSFITMDTLS